MVSEDGLRSVSRLVEGNLALAGSITSRLRRRYAWVDREELHSYALWGVTMAARAYCPDRGVPFSAFAAQKALYLAIDAMRQDKVLRRAGRHPGASTVCWSQLATVQCDEPLELADPRSSDAEQRSLNRDLVANLLCRLQSRDRKLLLLYYADRLTFAEIGEVFGLSESAISFRHKTVLQRLRTMAPAN